MRHSAAAEPVQAMRQYFEEVYAQGPDPYGLGARWYEQRKIALLLASLPHRRYQRVLEPACGVGELTLQLAPRCAHLLAFDFDRRAVEQARSRLFQWPQVQVRQLVLPQEFPHQEGPFDLIVLSEIGYFLQAAELGALAKLCRDSLTPDGCLAACHWLADFEQRTLHSPFVHAQLGASLAPVASYTDVDFVLDVWCRRRFSVAGAEGIT